MQVIIKRTQLLNRDFFLIQTDPKSYKTDFLINSYRNSHDLEFSSVLQSESLQTTLNRARVPLWLD